MPDGKKCVYRDSIQYNIFSIGGLVMPTIGGAIGKWLSNVSKNETDTKKMLDEVKKEMGEDKKIGELAKALEKISKDQAKLAGELQKALEKNKK
ncbi:hypothetical protein [Pseudorhodobacter sp. E13]|uniref:hypothetical protein n=1 Tax=Pseudorhodobacter sp. E13 TaxID=2487931 RepID=UPI0013158F99|nr:hypothetical protein [Pseudorhodobacter sp. E13]